MSFIVDSAAAGDAAQRAVLDRGDTTIYERGIAYIRRHRSQLANAIGSSRRLRQDVEDRPPAPTLS